MISKEFLQKQIATYKSAAAGHRQTAVQLRSQIETEEKSAAMNDAAATAIGNLLPLAIPQSLLDEAKAASEVAQTDHVPHAPR